MAKYEATTPITLIAGETIVADLRGLLCQISAATGATLGRAIRPASTDSDAPVVGTFAQDSMIAGEPVTVNLLSGKMQMIAEKAIKIGQIVHATDVADNRGKVNSSADFHATAINLGIALEEAVVNAPFQVLVVPYGVVG